MTSRRFLALPMPPRRAPPQGAGPSLIECVSYRWEPHSIFTRRETRPSQEIDEWKLKDPIARYRQFLIRTQEATADELSQIDSEVQAEVAKASAFAIGSPTPRPGECGPGCLRLTPMPT